MGIITDVQFMLYAVDEAILGLQENSEHYGAQAGCVLVDSDGNVISAAHNQIQVRKVYH